MNEEINECHLQLEYARPGKPLDDGEMNRIHVTSAHGDLGLMTSAHFGDLGPVTSAHFFSCRPSLLT